MKKLIILFFAFAFVYNVKSQTVFDIISTSADHETLESAVNVAGLNGALSGPGTFTVFAPTDDAFSALPSGVLDDLLLDPTGALADILLYHVLDTEVPASAVTNGLIADALNPANTLKLTVTSTGDVYVNQALVTITDLQGSNGVVHVIDAVVLPSETVVDVAIDNGFTTLTTAVVAAELLPALTDPAGTYTVFAPTDAAFDALPAGVLTDLLLDPTGALQDILLYHSLGSEVPASAVTNGLIADALSPSNTLKLTLTGTGNVFVNQAQVSLPDVGADNGIVHVIDAVVLPSETVVDVAIDNGFTTLTTAVVAAELLPALTDPAGTYTVFAPTDAAFEALPAGVLTDLLLDPTGALQDILLYHSLGSEVPASAVTNGLIADALSPSNTLKFTVTGSGSVFVNQAQVSLPDVGADNGIVHVIDAVVLPSETVVDVAIDNGFTTLTTAVVAAELLPALTDPAGTYTVFAPTDAAFDALPAGVLTDLLMDPTGALVDVLLYHVVGVEAFSTDLSDGQSIPTLQGSDVNVTIDGSVMINNATVELPDVAADNGVVHVIDMVLSNPTSIDEFEDLGIRIYPNPVAETIYLSTNEVIDIIEIFDVTGKKVMILNDHTENQIDVSGLIPGNYKIRVQNLNKTATLSILKE